MNKEQRVKENKEQKVREIAAFKIQSCHYDLAQVVNDWTYGRVKAGYVALWMRKTSETFEGVAKLFDDLGG